MRVLQAVDLPRMDYGAMGIGQGIDAYVKVKFAGAQLATKTLTVRGKELLHVDFNEMVRLAALCAVNSVGFAWGHTSLLLPARVCESPRMRRYTARRALARG